jgi:hypothetical protein
MGDPVTDATAHWGWQTCSCLPAAAAGTLLNVQEQKRTPCMACQRPTLACAAVLRKPNNQITKACSTATTNTHGSLAGQHAFWCYTVPTHRSSCSFTAATCCSLSCCAAAACSRSCASSSSVCRWCLCCSSDSCACVSWYCCCWWCDSACSSAGC